MATLTECKLMWSANKFDLRDLDLVLVVEDNTFGVHKDVLQRSSDYFCAMFESQMLETNKNIITLQSVPAETFQILLESFYTGQLNPTENNIWNLSETALMLHVSPSLLSKCVNFLLNMINVDSVFSIWFQSNCNSLYLVDVYNAARRFALANFLELIKSSSFQQLSLDELSTYLSDEYLVVESEYQRLEALHTWLCHSSDLPTQIVKELVSSCVHLDMAEESVEKVTNALLGSVLDLNRIHGYLKERLKPVDIYMFWSLVYSSKTRGPVDVVSLSPGSWEVSIYDSMQPVESSPSFDMGCAICTAGCLVYLSGGGNKFGAINWIKDIWRFDFSHPVQRWVIVGKLTETRRHHAMVVVDNYLYVFGGFGKFRVKNTKVERLQLSTGVWESLPAMPEHDICPATAVLNKDIYYLGKVGTMHVFKTASQTWRTHQFNSPLPPSLSPVALFVDPRKSNSFLGLFSRDGKICLLSLHLDQHSTLLALEELSLEMGNNLTFAGSVICDANVVLFFSSYETNGVHSSDTSESLIARCWCLYSGQITDNRILKGVCRASSFVTLPHISANYSPRIQSVKC